MYDHILHPTHSWLLYLTKRHIHRKIFYLQHCYFWLIIPRSLVSLQNQKKRPHLNKNEFELQKSYITSHYFGQTIGFLKHIATLGTVIFCFDKIIDGIQPLMNQSPAAITAFSRLIEAFNFSNITGYIVGTVAVGGWAYERKGKHRAISEKADYQQRYESGDAYRPTSGLTKTGATPKKG